MVAFRDRGGSGGARQADRTERGCLADLPRTALCPGPATSRGPPRTQLKGPL